MRSKFEIRCGKIVEELFGKNFEPFSPEWCVNVTGYPMEYDLCNEELKLIFEIDGEQHSQYSPHFHKNGVDDFVKQFDRDLLKEKLAKKHGYNLIRIPSLYYSDIDRLLKKNILTILLQKKHVKFYMKYVDEFVNQLNEIKNENDQVMRKIKENPNGFCQEILRDIINSPRYL